MIHQFTNVDREQPWCKALERSLEARLAALREKNDKRQDEYDTAFIRGQIAEIKNLLHDLRGRDLSAPKPVRRNPYD